MKVEWKCILCKKKYKQRGRLVRHLASIHRKKVFSFDSDEDLTAHKLANDGIITYDNTIQVGKQIKGAEE